MRRKLTRLGSTLTEANTQYEHRHLPVMPPVLLKRVHRRCHLLPPHHLPLQKALQNLGSAQVLLLESALGLPRARLSWPLSYGIHTVREGPGEKHLSWVQATLNTLTKWHSKWLRLAAGKPYRQVPLKCRKIPQCLGNCLCIRDETATGKEQFCTLCACLDGIQRASPRQCL